MRALLAGGLVLGVGAAATLAAWTDQEHTTATFTAGTFGIVGATDGTTFTEHASSGQAAALSFQVTPGAMAPGDTVYAPFSVRTTASSVAGQATLGAATENGTGLGAFLQYGVAVITGTTCNATTFAAAPKIVATGSSLTTGATAAQQLQAAAGNVVTYCFAVTMPATTGNAAQGQTVTARWTVNAQSVT
ncbi:SipW-dependent-type signal peptide-containing protein [Microbacterium sp. G2-8]|uniref:SipW-dependent-type signal peptide-containing protein n=1 Tax=Microbacterium sp. G2-8 TaxID=2842454 RepID=UPI0027E3499E|nr:SipW-dependent-type signal peptide-containing protein [Microbacterium sp. G2-8]